ncbi:MAG: LysR family transcriptional regulator [Ruminococcus bromii]|nr:LysR family transcriptional regulator [Ruminococcus bromii]
MNLLHMKYAVVVAETNSINKAAEKLFVGQPNLSRAIKELESNLGITLFERKAKGMFLTPDGEVFIRYAKNILKQIDEVETLFNKNSYSKNRFSISVPRASYIAEAFAKFTELIETNIRAEIFYNETDSMSTIKSVLQDDYKLGIIRYAESFDKYYKSMMDEKGIKYEIIAEFKYVLLMNKNCPLASVDNIKNEDLQNYIEISHSDTYVPFLPFGELKKVGQQDGSQRKIYVFERASQFEILSQNKNAYMWVSPIPKNLEERFGLVQRSTEFNTKVYKDMLINKKEYSYTQLDTMFVEQLIKSKRDTIGKY